MTNYSTYEELGGLVDSEDGLVLTTMEELRDAHGVGKLGVHVRAAIHERLAGQGLGHLPYELPSYQHEEVRIYRLGSQIAKVVNAVIRPSATGDDILRQSVGTDAQKTLAQVRELICS
ncbi:MAG: hypothetical protein ACRCYU_00940 [Nocardioides sp.]